MPDENRSENPEPATAHPPPEDEHEFLMPGPTPTSNEGCFTWGASWVVVSLVLILIVVIMTVGCFFISQLVGLL